jgi:competence protein ComEC
MNFLCIFLVLFPSFIDLDFQNQLVVWNIGQGQWITVLDKNKCIHFDVGGEFYNQNKISSLCSKKENFIFYSHWDWDHVGLTSKLKGSVKNLCIAVAPKGEASFHKKKLLSKIPVCNKPLEKVQQVHFQYPNSKNPNDLSQIFIYDRKFLIPGDSTQKMEKVWSPKLPNNLKWLSASHHGSRTSTSEVFLKHNPSIKQAFVSARNAVYGHPHKIVMDRLKNHGIAVLKTEDWGNIRILLK